MSTTLPVHIENNTATLTLSWADDAKINGGTLKGFAKTTSGLTVYAVYRFQSEEEKEQFMTLNLTSIVFTLEGTFEAVEIPSHPYAFHMDKYLRMYGASGIFEGQSIISAKSTSTILSRLAEQRQKVKVHIQRTFPESLISEAEALLIGDRSEMTVEEATVYKRLGITHLFAISGLHVGLLTFMVRELLLRLKIRRELVNLLLIAFLPIYAVLAGGAPSVWRAVSVTILVLLTVFGRVNLRLDSALALSAIGFMLYKPFIVFQPGFQLSYIAAFSLVLSSKILARPSSAIVTSFLVTTISQLSLYPILLFHFHELSISSFLVNIVYVPLYSVIILPANLIFLCLSFVVLPVAELLFFYYMPFREAVREVTGWIAKLPYQLWTPGKPNGFEVVFAVIGVLSFFVLVEGGKSVYRALSLVMIPALALQLLPYTDPTLRVTYLDVGQGDSAVIELPYRRAVYLVDTGGVVSFGEKNWKTPENSFEIGRRIVIPYLKGRGISSVDKLIISHAHADHMEAADEVLEEIRVKEIHIAPNSGDEKEMESLLRIASKQKVPIIEKYDGVMWMEGEVPFMYVGPQDEHYIGNDSSLVLFMKTTGPSFLFTGDMEEKAEADFLRKYKHVDWGEPILKVGHHGSKTSSAPPFIKALNPRLAIISAGRNNRYGHPSPEVMATFAEQQVPVLVTAENGSVMIKVKGEMYSIDVMRK